MLYERYILRVASFISIYFSRQLMLKTAQVQKVFSILETGTHAPVEPPPAPAMAFTIDFSTGDAKMGDKDSLSKFRPAKGRRSFRSRSLKQKSEDADDDRQVGGSTVLFNFPSRGYCN